MRLMLMNWATYLPDLVEAAKKLQSDGYEIVFWERSEGSFVMDKTAFPETIFRRHSYVGYKGEKDDTEYQKYKEFEPVGSDVVSSFFETETMVLPLLDRYYKQKNTQEKRQIYYDLLRYWHGMIKKLKPDVAIFEEVAHHPDTCVAYAVLKYFGVKTIIVNATNITDRLILTRDSKFSCPELLSRLHENIGKEFDPKKLSSEIRVNLEQGTCIKEAPIVSIEKYNECKRKSGSTAFWRSAKLRFWLKTFVSFRIWKIAWNYVKNRVLGNARKEYTRLQCQPDFAAKYVYVPLHYQPEANTNILGGMFVSQINLIEILSATLPEGWWIYVKEHPVQFFTSGIGYGNFRYKGFYERMAKIKGVRIVPVDTDTYRLSDNSQAVATVSGTASWEAALRLKPGIIFGYMWFLDCPGIFQIDNVEKCKNFFILIQNKDFNLSKKNLTSYLFALEEIMVRGSIYLLAKSESAIDENTNANNVYLAISKLL